MRMLFDNLIPLLILILLLSMGFGVIVNSICFGFKSDHSLQIGFIIVVVDAILVNLLLFFIAVVHTKS